MDKRISENKYLIENKLINSIEYIVETPSLVSLSYDDFISVIGNKERLYHYSDIIHFYDLAAVKLKCDFKLSDMIIYIESGDTVTLKEVNKLLHYVKASLGDDITILYSIKINSKIKRGEAKLFILAS